MRTINKAKYEAMSRGTFCSLSCRPAAAVVDSFVAASTIPSIPDRERKEEEEEEEEGDRSTGGYIGDANKWHKTLNTESECSRKRVHSRQQAVQRLCQCQHFNWCARCFLCSSIASDVLLFSYWLKAIQGSPHGRPRWLNLGNSSGVLNN